MRKARMRGIRIPPIVCWQAVEPLVERLQAEVHHSLWLVGD